MTQLQIKNSIFICKTIFLLVLEIIITGALQGVYIYPLLCYFMFIIPYETSWTQLATPLFCFALLSSYHYNIAGFSLIYILPLIPLSHILYNTLHVKKLLPFILLQCAFIAHFLLLSLLCKITYSINSILIIIICNNIILACSSYYVSEQ